MPETNPFREAMQGSGNPFREAAKRMNEAAAVPQTAVGTATGISRSIGQGVTFGFADEMEAGVKALINRQGGEDFATAYRRHRDLARQQMGQFREQSPVLSIGGEVAGGLVPGLATARAAGAFVQGGRTLARQVGRAGLLGAAEGAAYGAGAAEELEDVPGGMVRGAAIGGAVGAAIPAAVAGARGVVGAVRGATRPQFGADMRVAQAIARDGMTPDQVARQLHEARTLGRPATVADVGGQNVRRELEIATQRPGAGAALAEEFLSQRNKDQLRRLSTDLVQATGVAGDDVADVIETTMLTRAQAATPVYAKAMQFTAELNDDIVRAYEKAAKSPLGKQAMAKAKRILNVENFDDAPLMARIDAFKKGLDDVIQSAKQGGERQIARAGTKLLRTDAGDGLLDVVDAANPTYRQAREIWSDGETYLEAISEGRKIMAPSVTASDLRRQWRGFTDVEREAYKIGAVDAIITRMRQQSAQEPNLLRLLRSPEIKDKLTAMMTPAEAQRFGRLIDVEESMFQTANQARRGSPTAQRQAAMDEQEKQTRLFGALGAIFDMVTQPIRQTFVRGIPGLTGMARDAVLARQNEAIAQRLLSGSPASMRPAAAIGAAAAPSSGRLAAAATPAAISPLIEDEQ